MPVFGSRGAVSGVRFTSVSETVGVVPAGTGCPVMSGVVPGAVPDVVPGMVPGVVPGTEMVLGIGTEPSGLGSPGAPCGIAAPCGGVPTVPVPLDVVTVAGTVPLVVPGAAPVVTKKTG